MYITSIDSSMQQLPLEVWSSSGCTEGAISKWRNLGSSRGIIFDDDEPVTHAHMNQG